MAGRKSGAGARGGARTSSRAGGRVGSQSNSRVGSRVGSRATGRSSAQTASKSNKMTGVIVGAVAGVAVAGGVGVAVYNQVAGPVNNETYVLSEYEKDEDGESVYAVTDYRLSKAKNTLEELSVRRSDTASSAYNSNGLVPEGWKDLDENGCDTRYDVLAGVLVGAKESEKCKVEAGKLFDYYTGEIVAYDSGIDIDHIVAKKNAWNSGGYKWSAEKWTEFVNDAERELLATSDTANRSKQDKDAADWLPPNEKYWCVYVIKQIEVKDYYGLSVRAEEKEKMSEVLREDCETK